MNTTKKKPDAIAQVGRTIAKAGLSTAGALILGPGGAIAAAGIGEIVDQAIGRLVENRRKRLERFHSDLLTGKPGDEQRELLLSRITKDEVAAEKYATILEKVAQDDEDAKTKVYAKLLRFLLERSINEGTERHLIRSVRDLASTDFDVLTTLSAIGGKAHETATVNEQVAHLDRQQKYAKRGDPLVVAAVQRLEHAGFIARTGAWDGDQLDMTALGNLLLEVLGQ